MHTKLEAVAAMEALRRFIGREQTKCLADLCRGEEKQFFFDKLCELRDIISTMPKTYEQDGAGKDAVIYLHYFTSGCDWHITEKDMELEQLQAFGLSDLGYGAELDLYWTPRTIAEQQAKSKAREA
jgi:hypothetical protein